MFVHFDSSRPWDARPDQPGEWLTGAVLHELGHVLGLGHSSDPNTLMFADTRAAAPQAADLAGLHSLYGGGAPRVGDLTFRSGSAGGAVLRGGVPPGTAWCMLDVDDDPAHELLVWSVAPDGLGALIVYHFGPGVSGPHLTSTTGPFLGALPPDGRHEFHEVDGDAWLLTRFADGASRVLRFSEDGALTHADPAVARALQEHWRAPSAVAVLQPGATTSADLDGDGIEEIVSPH